MLPDLLDRHLDLVVCGTGAGSRSAEVGQYYAGPGNRFWRTLAEVELTPEELRPDEYERLLKYGIGLTDLVKEHAGNDRDLQFRFADVIMLRTKLMGYQPWYLCFNGKRAAQEFLGLPSVAYGVQAARYGRTVLYVAPSTSAAANGSWDVSVWQDLARRVLRPRGKRSRPRTG
jgi:TDG/mug DNA glycosylase family protein